MRTHTPVLIVGAGLSGLACARGLAERGVECHILEAAGEVGGRVRTDEVDGFLLDRGFQVFLTAYPEARRALDYAGLNLRPFYPGALVRAGGRFHRVADPLRHPIDALASLLSPTSTLADKFRIAALRASVARGTAEELFGRPETTTDAALRGRNFSAAITEQFFRPFFGGVFLERALETSSRLFEFTFRMFAGGDAALPAEGMGAIPRQLAAMLPPDSITLRAHVDSIEAHGGSPAITLASGERLTADAVVVAVDEVVARKLLGHDDDAAPPKQRSVANLYFAAEKSPVDEQIIVLNGEGRGPVNNLCVPSRVAPSYAPPGASLVSVSVLEDAAGADDASLEAALRVQLGEWFGAAVRRWRHLRTYKIKRALPAQPSVSLATHDRTRTSQPKVYACGDYLDTASINGALRAGRLAAEAVAEDFAARHTEERAA